jgi:hypothetical protein
MSSTKIIGFRRDLEFHKWIKRKKGLAFSRHDQHKITDEEIVVRIGCTEGDIRTLFETPRIP